MAETDDTAKGGAFSIVADINNGTQAGSVFATEVPGILNGQYEYLELAITTLENDIQDAKEETEQFSIDASDSAAAASSSATSSANSASSSAASASASATSASESAASATESANSATSANASQIAAASSAGDAETAQTAAETAQAAAEAVLSSINGTYLGSQASNPTVDLNGDPVTVGDWYFNTTSNITIIYDGTNWNAIDPQLSGDLSPTLSANLDAAEFDLVNVDDINVNTVSFDTHAVMSWNTEEGTLDVAYNSGSGVTLQMGQEEHFYAKATEAISNGDVVMFAGAQGGHLLMSKADINAVGFEPSHVMGLATQDFALNDFGYVTSFGKVRDLDTSALSEGDILYLDPTTAGAVTTTKPSPPNHIIQLAAVTRSHGTQGTVFVRPTHQADTDETPEGTSNLYYTDSRSRSAISVSGDLSYDSGTGIISYSTPTIIDGGDATGT